MIQVGPSPVTISELGRWKLSGNSRVATVKIVQQNNVDLPGALVTVNMANGAVGTFVYSALPAPITLAANTSYYLVTSVTKQGDTWYDLNQKVTSTGGVSVGPTVWAPEVGGYSLYGAGGTSFGPVGLKGGSGAQIGVTTTVATYEYDDENQLTSITLGTQSRTIFRYDGKRRRRVTREETMGSSGNWVLATETRYVYDGMRVVQERNGNGIPTVAYTRGPDLSGTLEGAGGIGGLLARSEWDGGSWSQHAFYHSDGVGNVTALAVPSGGDIALAGGYRYDPFGRLIGTPTDLAARNTQRFSSKDWHNPSGFYYFGYRFYDPATQRWLNRDPIGENGGVNLYGYVENDPINWVDVDGLSAWRLEGGHGGWHFQLGDSRWDAQTLRPVEHLGNTPTALNPGQLEEIRKAGLLDKAGKLFPEGVVAREAAAAGLTAGKMLKLSKNLAKPICKTLGRVAGPLAVVGAVSDVKAIGQTAVTGAQAASAAGNALSSTLETQSKMNNQRLMNGDDLSDDEITHWMSHRIGR